MEVEAHSQLQRATEALIAGGISLGDLSLLVSRSTARKFFAPTYSLGDAGEDTEFEGPFGELAANLVAASGNAAVLAAGPMMTALAARRPHSMIGDLTAGLAPGAQEAGPR